MPDHAEHAAACAPLFTPFRAAGLDLRTRVVMAPMTRRLAPDDGVPTPDMAAYYARRAAGEVGLIVTEGTHVDGVHAPDTPNVPGIWTEGQRDGWARVVRAVHDEGGRIAMQLWHTGRHAMNPIGPSAVPAKARDGSLKATPRAMDEGDMARATEAFARGAALAREAGFDAVEVHGAHGYLLDSFLSPESNTRADDYGGSLENRMRFPLGVLRAVRAAVGDGYPILYRFSQWKIEDYAARAYPDPDTLGTWVAALRDAGADVLHVSTRAAVDTAFDGSSRTLAGWTRRLSGLPVIAVGRVGLSASMNEGERADPEDPAPAAALIAGGEADLVAVGRGLIADADWCRIVRDGRWTDLSAYDRAMLETLA